MDLKAAGNAVYLVGVTKRELGASQYHKLFGAIGNDVPTVDAKVAKRTFDALSGEQRIALLLVDREGLDYNTAAEVIGIAPGTLASRLFRARQLLRAALENDQPEAPR